MPKAILLFPGQGSQTAGMGRALAEAKSWAMDFWKLGEKISGLPLREIYWEGDEAAMSNTRALQPALTVVNCNLYEAVRSKVSAVGAAGHSLGEFCALVAAHVLEAKDALSLTSLRGRLMAEADPKGDGGMLAVVKLDSSVVLEIVEEVKAELSSVLVAANFNTPFQTVLSGDKKALELAQSKVKARKGRAIALKVSGAFHSPLMAEANAEFGKILEKVTWHDASFPVYSNVDGCGELSGPKIATKVAKQMISSVQWVKTIDNQVASGARAWLELGPKSLLNKMVSACLPADLNFEPELTAVTNWAELKQFLGE